MKGSLLVATLVAVDSFALTARGETVYFGTVFPLKGAATQPTTADPFCRDCRRLRG